MATRPTPPPWDTDRLSAFFSRSGYNARVCALTFPDVYALLQRVYETFARVTDVTANDVHAHLLPSRFLMARTEACFLAAVRLGMSGEVVEAYMPIRGMIETAWYALHLAKDPSPPTRIRIWANRGSNADAQRECRREFTIANVRSTHEALDPRSSSIMQTLYDWTIDLGAHPNEQGIFAAMTGQDVGDQRVFNVEVLSENPTLVLNALKMSVEAAIGALMVIRLIFPERVAITGLDREIAELAAATYRVFQGYAAKVRLERFVLDIEGGQAAS